ncbi:hypothetical protein ACTHOQ_18645 [Solibacillus silvestris]|uniref:hypothetical protein n=1 Tax=Solibacillus silvestris TaxID=76853 RepID=UPI003F7D753C
MIQLKFMKSFSALTLSVLLLSGGVNGYASAEENENIHYPHSTEIVEASELLNKDVTNKSNKDEIVAPLSSFIKYEANGYAGSPRGVRLGYDDKFMLFHHTSFELPTGVTSKYTWERTVSKTNYSSHTFDQGARAQGGAKFIAELEGHFNYTYDKQKSVTVTAGTKSETDITIPGYYELDFYLKANVYDVYGQWWGTTIDRPNERRKLERYLGTYKEPTDFMHLRATKIR